MPKRNSWPDPASQAKPRSSDRRLNSPVEQRAASRFNWRSYLLFILVLIVVWEWPLISGLVRQQFTPKGEAATFEQFRSTINEPTHVNQFAYPTLNIDVPVSLTANTSPWKIADWSKLKRDLRQGTNLSFIEDSFDQASLAFLTGHSTDLFPHRYSSVFAFLNKAQVGDMVYLTVDKTVIPFTVTSKAIIDPADIPAFEALRPPAEENIQRLALVTCWPLFTTRDRLVVLADRPITWPQ